MISIHKTADVSKKAKIGNNTSIWHQAQIRENTTIGKNCIIAKGVYVDSGVSIGNNVKVENYASLFKGAIVEDDVFIGPYACLTNDKNPRATVLGKLQKESDWDMGKIVIKKGASLGAGVIILPNIIVGSYALIGAGAVVTKNVEDHALLFGNPAKRVGYVCFCGKIISKGKKPKKITCTHLKTK